MNINFEIGDSFIIDWNYIKKMSVVTSVDIIDPSVWACKHKEKVFQIKRFSKSGLSVYFDSFKTNKKGCRCPVCGDLKTEKSIGKDSIIYLK